MTDFRPYRIHHQSNALGQERWTVGGPHPITSMSTLFRRVRSQRAAERVARRWLRRWQKTNTWREVFPEEHNT